MQRRLISSAWPVALPRYEAIVGTATRTSGSATKGGYEICLQPRIAYQLDAESVRNWWYEEGKSGKKKFKNVEVMENYIENNKKIKFVKPMRYGDAWKEIKIKCGKCTECKFQHANEWATRATLETKTQKDGIFITLTYDPEHLPKDRSVHKDHLQKWWKRLRKHYKGHKIKYLACGEYGAKNRRPHYHALIWGLPHIEDLKPHIETEIGNMLYTSQTIEKIWGKGFIIIGKATYESACYVARYTTKKQSNYNKLGKEHEFITMSNGIGRDYFEQNKEKIIEMDGILIKTKDQVKVKQIPRYFEKLYVKPEKITINGMEFITYKENEEIELEKLKYERELNRIEKEKEKTITQENENELKSRTWDIRKKIIDKHRNL